MIKWISDYQLFLFDLDGLLVNTEHLHFQAYKNMCAARGFDLAWDFPRYSLAAHYQATGLRDQIYAQFPALQQIEPKWEVLYAEKKKAYKELLLAGALQLMPGVEKILKFLADADAKRCVVTHSPSEQVNLIREKLPLLNSIPAWFTREHYSQPKPSPEGYLKAIDVLGEKGDKIVGFEDSPRGLQALKGAAVNPVLVCSFEYPDLQELLQGGVTYFQSFDQLIAS